MTKIYLSQDAIAYIENECGIVIKIDHPDIKFDYSDIKKQIWLDAKKSGEIWIEGGDDSHCDLTYYNGKLIFSAFVNTSGNGDAGVVIKLDVIHKNMMLFIDKVLKELY